MLKRFISCMITVVMLFSMISISIPQNVVYAAGNIKLEVIKDNAPVRNKSSDSGTVLRRLKKGTIITAEKKELTIKLRWWYKLKDGEYIHSGNVKPAHDHKVVIVGYEKAHPHYALHECKGCDSGGSCGPETQKVKGCEKCYPTSTESKKENTNKIPNSNLTTPADILVPSRPSLQEEAEKNLGTPVHKHNYTLSGYESAHPHYAVYKCSCPDSYKDNSKTQKQANCSICYPHSHDYKLVGYNQQHPHYATYQCSCKAAYTSAETAKVKDCSSCYPYGYGNDHACQFVCTSKFLNEHPHYTITECSVCGKQDLDRKDTNYSKSCKVCNSEFGDKLDKLPDFHGRVYDLSTGGIIYTPEKVTLNQLYSFAEQAHLTLDALGLIPAVGEVFDGINVLYYIVEGNYVDAALSGAAMVPFVGVVSTSGKIVKNAGKLVIDVSTGTVKNASKKVTREIIEEGLENITDFGQKIIRNSDNYSKSTIKGIKQIAENGSPYLDEVFYNGKILITKEYKGTVRSRSGLKYGYVKRESKNRIYHIIDRHAYEMIGESTAENFFRYNGEDIFYVIEDVYRNAELIADPIPRGTYLAYYYKSPYVIGSDGEDILCLILEEDRVISAYPVYDLP